MSQESDKLKKKLQDITGNDISFKVREATQEEIESYRQYTQRKEKFTKSKNKGIRIGLLISLFLCLIFFPYDILFPETLSSVEVQSELDLFMNIIRIFLIISFELMLLTCLTRFYDDLRKLKTATEIDTTQESAITTSYARIIAVQTALAIDLITLLHAILQLLMR